MKLEEQRDNDSMTLKLSTKIRLLRKDKELSLEELATLTHTSKSYLWELENNTSRNPTKDKLSKIADALDVPVNYLVNETSQRHKVSLEQAFFRKFNKLSFTEKKAITSLIDIWSKKKR